MVHWAGGKGLLADEEQRLIKLRQEKEEEVTQEIRKQRQLFEKEARAGQLDKLCATPFGVDVVGITEFIALTGALVGGVTASFLLSAWPVHVLHLLWQDVQSSEYLQHSIWL